MGYRTGRLGWSNAQSQRLLRVGGGECWDSLSLHPSLRVSYSLFSIR